jgi:hypothetical protein
VIHLHPLERNRLQCGVEHLHRLGPHAAAEYLAEVAGHIGDLSVMLWVLDEYETRRTPEILVATGGVTFPPRPLHVVPR